MLCASCGTKVQLRKSILICKTCDSEFDFFDIGGELIPEPVFVPIRLFSQYAIIDTRKQVVYVLSDTHEKAELIANLLNKHLAQTILDKQLHS